MTEKELENENLKLKLEIEKIKNDKNGMNKTIPKKKKKTGKFILFSVIIIFVFMYIGQKNNQYENYVAEKKLKISNEKLTFKKSKDLILNRNKSIIKKYFKEKYPNDFQKIDFCFGSEIHPKDNQVTVTMCTIYLKNKKPILGGFHIKNNKVLSAIINPK